MHPVRPTEGLPVYCCSLIVSAQQRQEIHLIVLGSPKVVCCDRWSDLIVGSWCRMVLCGNASPGMNNSFAGINFQLTSCHPLYGRSEISAETRVSKGTKGEDKLSVIHIEVMEYNQYKLLREN